MMRHFSETPSVASHVRHLLGVNGHEAVEVPFRKTCTIVDCFVMYTKHFFVFDG